MKKERPSPLLIFHFLPAVTPWTVALASVNGVKPSSLSFWPVLSVTV